MQKDTQCFLSFVRESDLVARFGGDELVILLPETGVDSWNRMILWLLRKDKGPVQVQDHPNGSGCYVLIEKKE